MLGAASRQLTTPSLGDIGHAVTERIKLSVINSKILFIIFQLKTWQLWDGLLEKLPVITLHVVVDDRLHLQRERAFDVLGQFLHATQHVFGVALGDTARATEPARRAATMHVRIE
jgi:hypothetical protein